LLDEVERRGIEALASQCRAGSASCWAGHLERRAVPSQSANSANFPI